MIQQYKDLYGKPLWPITHIDAVIDNNGRTLRQILGDIPSAESVLQEIEKIIKDAPAAFDTLKEIADYIEVNGYTDIAHALADKANLSDIPTATSLLNNDSGFLTHVKTINNMSLEGEGNITISGSGLGDVVAGDVVETVDDVDIKSVIHGGTLFYPLTHVKAIEDLDTTLLDYAKTHGKYKGLTSGLAENFEGGEIPVTAGYTERFTAVDGYNENEVADGLVKMTDIKGRVSGWNQSMNNSNLDCNDGTKTYSATDDLCIGTANNNLFNMYSASMPINTTHKYYVSALLKASRESIKAKCLFGVNEGYGDYTDINSSTFIRVSSVCVPTTSEATSRFYVYFYNIAANDVVYLSRASIIDLTILNPTLAAKQNLTVAEVEAYLASINRVKPYYPYNAGVLLGARMKGWSILSTPNLLNPVTKSARLLEYNYTGHNNEYTIKNLPSDAKIKFIEDKVGDNLPQVTNLAVLPSVGISTINGITFEVTSNSIIVKAGGAATATIWSFVAFDVSNYVSGHKYLIEGCPLGGGSTTYSLSDGSGYFNDEGSGFIGVLNDTLNPRLVVRKNYTVTSNLVFKPLMVDLTATFGAGNEPATVAEAEKMLFGVIPITDDHFTIPSTGTASIVNASNYEPYSGDGNLATSWLIATWDGSKDDIDNFKPYEESNADIDSANIYYDNNGTMTQVFEGGIMKSTGDNDSDVSDELWFDKVEKKWKAEVCVVDVDLTNLEWDIASGSGDVKYFKSTTSIPNIKDISSNAVFVYLISAMYKRTKAVNIHNGELNSVAVAASRVIRFSRDNGNMTTSEFKTSLSGQHLFCERNSPAIYDTLYYKVVNDYIPMEEVFPDGITNFGCNWATEALAQEAEVNGQSQSITPIVTEVFNEDLKEALKSLIDEHENNVNLDILRANLVALCTCINTKLDVSISVSETPNNDGVFTFS